jgi:tetratricopeptide (TPR) repeat protein
MKSEKRHELQKNELAEWMGEQLEAARPHAFAIVLGIVLVIGAIVLFVAYSGAGGAAGAVAWNKYFSALNERDPSAALDQLASAEAGTPVGLWATQSYGDHFLTSATMEMFRDRDTAKKSLEKAETAYKKVESAASDPLLKSRARLGLGKVYESLNQTEEAAKWYKLVADTQKDTAIGKAAAKAAERMADPREIAALAWFAQQKPRLPTPTPGAGSPLPGLPNDLPERPDLSLPGLGLDGIGAEKPESPAVEFPKPGETKPPEEKPAEKPAEPKPAEPPAVAKPAEKPAEPKP